MKLTELKRCIDEALKLHDDYDVRILAGDDFNETEIIYGGIDSGRFCFNIHVDISSVLCEGYHIEDDNSMTYCNICDVYYSADEECPGCELKVFKRSIKKII